MTAGGDKPVRMAILSVPWQLRLVRGALEKLCESLGLSSSTAGQVVLSVDEALTNVIRHAYKGAEDRPIEIEFSVVGEAASRRLRIGVRDFGASFSPGQTPGVNSADLRPGGLGVPIISKCMDLIEYLPAAGGGTLLVLEKKLSPEGQT